MWLDHFLVSTGLLDGMRSNRREDRDEGPWTAGSIQYIAAEGAYVSATVQRPPRPLDDAVFTYGGECQIEVWASGTEAVTREVDPGPTGFAQVLLRRSDGVTVQITAGGIAGRRVTRPLSRDEVRQLAGVIDVALTNNPPSWTT
jgi:hypothetical protein